MTYTEAVKTGFEALNRNWQLILIHLLTSFIGCIGFFLIVVLPLIAVLIVMGVSPTDITRLHQARDMLITQHFGFLLVAGTLFVVYLFLVASLGIYAFAAASGLIARSVQDHSEYFSVRSFFSCGNRLFLPFCGFSALIGLLALGAVLLYGISVIAAVGLIKLANGLSSAFAAFLGMFLLLSGLISGFFVLFALMTLTVYGAASLSLKGQRVFEALKETTGYLIRQPSAFLLYLVLSLLYFFCSFLLSFVGLPLRAVPVIGWMVSFPYQILLYILQGYAGFLVLAVSFVYYHRTYSREEEKPIGGTSMPVNDISPPEGGGHGSPHPRIPP